MCIDVTLLGCIIGHRFHHSIDAAVEVMNMKKLLAMAFALNDLSDVFSLMIELL